MIFAFLLTILISYFLGSIPFAYIVGKLKGIDIREHGSGNVGTTNTLRTLGKLPAIVVLILDAGKGFLAVFISGLIFEYYKNEMNAEINYQIILQITAAFMAILGHIYTFWLKFKGGKGVATGLGVLIAIAPKLLIIAIVFFILAVVITKMVSLGSILAALSLPASFFIFYNIKEDNILFGFLIVVSIFIVLKHKSNIKRIFTGTESKISFKKK